MKYFNTKRTVLFLIGALLISTLFFVGIRAQEEEEIKDEPILEEQDTQGYISSPDVVPYALLNQDQKTVELGKETEVVLGFLNTGDLPFSVQFIRGYLLMNQDQPYIVQNFTGALQNVTVGPEETATFSYKFTPEKMLDSREYTVMVDVFYLNVENDTFSTTFFNQTIQFVEAAESADFETVFSYISLFGMLGLMAFGAWYLFKGTPQYKKVFGASSASSTTTSTENIVTDKNKNTINLDFIPQEHRKHLKLAKKD
ncbi:translocon-associated protein, alpha subunit [Naegleria gruberi]|uniref:Translocon-associated protein, alpha subunit n=1 Tax=Naegleria gruberi TaxID=5762 RepID=D2V2I1_NAEGR|nr:translocon-associated protein, alpha subunit [Naegleria gruberi]EFC49062.1 translocon-associated protein, alpha subunit [Naegleria gruberi]|eukprot:XP_002681806.1 translocon-associated protein, alpha subunit [Naegleria gruberi strain NEG-M]